MRDVKKTAMVSIGFLPLLAILISGLAAFAAHQPATSSASQTYASTTSGTNANVQEFYPNYQSSIIIPADGNDTNLASLAKMTPDEAKTAATSYLSVSESSVQSVSLENENGNLVYSVYVVKQGITYELKVDAGNGKVLFVEQGVDNEAGAIGDVEGRRQP